MMNSKLRQFVPGDRVASHNGRNQLERVKNSKVIPCEALFRVTPSGPTGSAVATSGDSVNMVCVRQLLGEAVENMRGEAQASQQYNGPARSAPIEDFQPDAIFHGHELHLVLRRIVPRAGLLRSRHWAG